MPSDTSSPVAHTPGPWAIDRDDRPGMAWNNHIVQADRPHMAICFMTHSGRADNSECEANARLIAAAPDLLEALEGLAPILDNDGPLVAAYADMRAKVDAAIKKARGQ